MPQKCYTSYRAHPLHCVYRIPRKGGLLEQGQPQQRLCHGPSLAARPPLSSPGETLSLCTAIKIGSNELEAIRLMVFVLSVLTILYTNISLLLLLAIKTTAKVKLCPRLPSRQPRVGTVELPLAGES